MNNDVIGDLRPIALLEPVFQGDITVFEALKMRKTCRTISDRKIPLQILSDILWAAQGVNRTDGPFCIPGLTAGSASNSQEIRIYVAREEGTYLYEPVAHRLLPVASGDIRALAIGAGQGNAGADAPVRFIYVVDIEKFNTAGFPGTGALRSGNSEILLLRRYRPDSPKRVSGSSVAGAGHLVSQLQQVGSG